MIKRCEIWRNEYYIFAHFTHFLIF